MQVTNSKHELARPRRARNKPQLHYLIQTNDIWMPHTSENADLATHTLGIGAIHNARLLQNLDGHLRRRAQRSNAQLTLVFVFSSQLKRSQRFSDPRWTIEIICLVSIICWFVADILRKRGAIAGRKREQNINRRTSPTTAVDNTSHEGGTSYR